MQVDYICRCEFGEFKKRFSEQLSSKHLKSEWEKGKNMITCIYCLKTYSITDEDFEEMVATAESTTRQGFLNSY